jgi:hypothetical protein
MAKHNLLLGILINPAKGTFTKVSINDWEDIAPLLGCINFDVVSINDTNDLYVDDEGLFDINPSTMFIYRKGYQPLAGKGLVLGLDEEGASTHTTMTIDELKEMFTFITTMEVWKMDGNY